MAPKPLDSRREQLNNIRNYTTNRFPLAPPNQSSVEPERNRQALARMVGVTNAEILTELEALGFTHQTARILHLVPCVQVAWSSGEVTERERKLVERWCRRRSVQPGSEAWNQLNRWLDTRPPKQFFMRTLEVLRQILDSMGVEERDRCCTNLLCLCLRTAQASGGSPEFGESVTEDEREALNRIANQLIRRDPAQSTVAAGK
ncbi:MAG: hypothetical protein K1Y36_22865 [Blastocatellia bacterium]|nr:hypothetical protein [Blastocatellia bacterium]